MLYSRTERDFADRVPPMLVLAGEIVLERERAVPCHQHGMDIGRFRILEPLCHRAQGPGGWSVEKSETKFMPTKFTSVRPTLGRKATIEERLDFAKSLRGPLPATQRSRDEAARLSGWRSAGCSACSFL